MTNKTADLDKIKSKINKLLALGASPNRNEAETAMRQAMALMRKYAICETELGVSQVATFTYKSGFTKLPPWCVTLANNVSRALGVYCVYMHGSHGSKAQIFFTGEKGACERAEYIYVVAYRQIESMSSTYRNNNPGCSPSDTNDYKRGVAISYAQRVKEVYGQVEQELSDELGTALVPIDTRIEEAKAYYCQSHEVVVSKADHRNSIALHDGVRDGKNVQVTEGVKGNTDKTLALGTSAA